MNGDGVLSAFVDAARTRWSKLPGNVRGSVWLLSSGLVVALMVSTVKHLGQRLPVVEILFFRQVFVLVFMAPALYQGFPGIFRANRAHLHLARILLSVVAMLTGFTAVVNMPLAEVTAISFSRGLFTIPLAILILHETVGIRRWSATIVGFIGVLVIVRPTPENVNIYALLALGSAFLVAFILIITRTLAQTERPATIMVYHSFGLTLLLAAPAVYFWVTPTLDELILMVLAGFLMSIGQYGNIKAYQAGETAAIQPMEYGRLLFATVIGIFIFAEFPSIWTLSGGAVIIASGIYTIHRNAIRKSPIAVGDAPD